MSAISNFAFEDHLVRVVKLEDQPWFVGRDVCKVLQIKNETQALARLDDDERQDGVCVTDPIGRQQSVIGVSEPGVFRLIFTSRKPEAERFKRWLAHEVLPSLRRNGHYSTNPAKGLRDCKGDPFEISNESAQILNVKLALVRECRQSFGPERSRALWPAIGLPMLPVPARGGQDDARACLEHLRIAELPGEKLAAFQIQDAMEDDQDATDLLRRNGVIVQPDRGILIANRHPWLARVYQGTAWQITGWAMTLRQLPGADPGGKHRFGTQEARSTFIPEVYLNPFTNEGREVLM